MNLFAKNLLILASAGSGKTFQLSNRIIGLAARGTPPERLVALTFTRKAAGEFTDALLTKLATAASDRSAASKLAQEVSAPNPDFQQLLRSFVQALPGISFGTMDGFFSRIVRGFQFELGLTGGRFELIEGPRASAIADDLLGSILGHTLQESSGEVFFHAFRRSLIGREEQGVLASLREFVRRWQAIYQESGGIQWGPAELADLDPSDWENHKNHLAASALEGLSGIEFTHSKQAQALEAAIFTLEQHTIGSGSLGSKAPTLLQNILEACATSPSGPLFVKFQKDFTIGGTCAAALRQMVLLAARCEFAAALTRTRAIREVVAVFDQLCAKRLREKGLLGFHEVKLLMGAWARDEDARLRREAVDFRLDSRHEHWLLDEFQDTSQAEWRGLETLIDEAATNDNGSLFVVGDKKQAIYAWRGGDVSLFDELTRRYGKGLDTAPMVESWRSCPEVLELVNRIFGDHTVMSELFGEVASRWDWQDHVSAPPLQTPEKQGHAMVEVTGPWEDRLERMREILSNLGIGNRSLSCGVLLRGNKEVHEVADFLRTHGFDVIEEGQRKPSSDHPAGILVLHLLKWLANPSDTFAKEVIAMSPLAKILLENHGSDWWRVWEALTRQLAETGYARTVQSWINSFVGDLSGYSELRVADIIAQLAQLDAQGEVSIHEAVDSLERLEISQSPGSGAIQVMTIHKSKGLGFDVVILPEIPDSIIPQSQFFDLAFGPDWVSQTPPKWARRMIPALSQAEDQWADHQRYESFCLLYVALTRAKRGLYILLDEPAKSADPNKASLARWISLAAGTSDSVGGKLEFGSPDWADHLPITTKKPTPPEKPKLGRIAESIAANRPSHPTSSSSTRPFSQEGSTMGTLAHAILERITWMDENPPEFRDEPLADQILNCVSKPAFRSIFFRDGRSIELLREQPIEIHHESERIRGTVDRLHLHRSPTGSVQLVEIFDFKTDADCDPNSLRNRHHSQMAAYHSAIQKIFPEAKVLCHLVPIRGSEPILL